MTTRDHVQLKEQLGAAAAKASTVKTRKDCMVSASTELLGLGPRAPAALAKITSHASKCLIFTIEDPSKSRALH